METLLPILIVLLLVAVGVLGFFLWRLSQGLNSRGQNRGNEMLLLQQQLQELSRTLDAKMAETTRTMHRAVETQFGESQRLIRDINKEVNEQMMKVVKEVSQVSESSKQVFTVAEQLQNLEKVLKHKKQRGNLGEASLHLALENMLPAGAYHLQYQFPGGETVDAVVVERKLRVNRNHAVFRLNNRVHRLPSRKLILQVIRPCGKHVFERELERRLTKVAALFLVLQNFFKVLKLFGDRKHLL